MPGELADVARALAGDGSTSDVVRRAIETHALSPRTREIAAAAPLTEQERAELARQPGLHGSYTDAAGNTWTDRLSTNGTRIEPMIIYTASENARAALRRAESGRGQASAPAAATIGTQPAALPAAAQAAPTPAEQAGPALPLTDAERAELADLRAERDYPDLTETERQYAISFADPEARARYVELRRNRKAAAAAQAAPTPVVASGPYAGLSEAQAERAETLPDLNHRARFVELCRNRGRRGQQ